MEKSKEYRLAKFPPEVIREAYAVFFSSLDRKHRSASPLLNIEYKDESWGFDDKEEFLSEYRKEVNNARFLYSSYGRLFDVIYYAGSETKIRISLPHRQDIERVFEVFEQNYERSKIPESDLPKGSKEIKRLEKCKRYRQAKFSPEVIKKAYTAFCSCLDEGDACTRSTWYVNYKDEYWGFANEEEFFSEYRKDVMGAQLRYSHSSVYDCFDVKHDGDEGTRVTISLPSRQDIEKVFAVFEASYEESKLPEEESKKAVRENVKVFIGHGRSPQWRDLKDHLQDKHHFKVTAYETGPRAGYWIFEVLKEMSEEASIGFLVHTAEDEDKDGGYHARENVIHETGLFQGRLGAKRAIVLLEEGCNEFSNISGIQQLRFNRNNIKEVFGDVVSTIYREFGTGIED